MAEQVLKRSTLAAFAAPAIPISGLGLPLVVYLPPFYAEQMGLGLALVGTIFMVTRFWDVVTDPLLGVLSDRFKTRWGRRRQWIVAAVPILLLAVSHIFLPSPPVTGAYLLGWLFVLYVGWTLLTISHMSWGAELSPDYHERSRVQGWREIFLIAGMITVLGMPALMERTQLESVGVDRVAAMGWFIMLLLPLTVGWAVTRVPERPVPDPPHIGWRRAASIVVQNLPLRRVLLMDLVSGLGGGIIAALFLFVADDMLGLGSWASALLLVYFFSGCVCVPLIVRISYRFGKHRTLAGSSLFNGLCLPGMFLIPEGNIPVAALAFLVFGANVGVGPFLFRSLMADVADHDRVESGAQRTGFYFSLLTMTNKVGAALAIGVIYPVLDWIGYVPGGDNSPAEILGLASLYVWPPVAISILVAVMMWTYPLDLERQRELRSRIAALDADPEPAL